MEIEKLKTLLEGITKKEIAEFINEFPKVPYGWVDINEHLPQVYAMDYLQIGYSVFKVKDVNGKIMKTKVCDGMMWLYAFAKPNEITHWWNDQK